MTKLIYEIARPFCGYHEVTQEVYENPPQLKGSPTVEYRKRILSEATPKQIIGQSDAPPSLLDLAREQGYVLLRQHEHDARSAIIRNIVKAKRELKIPMDSAFFRDIWPKALAALQEKTDGND